MNRPGGPPPASPPGTRRRQSSYGLSAPGPSPGSIGDFARAAVLGGQRPGANYAPATMGTAQAALAATARAWDALPTPGRTARQWLICKSTRARNRRPLDRNTGACCSKLAVGSAAAPWRAPSATPALLGTRRRANATRTVWMIAAMADWRNCAKRALPRVGPGVGPGMPGPSRRPTQDLATLTPPRAWRSRWGPAARRTAAPSAE